ncbi:hypothetical protein [Aureimonas sp. AU40]|uniref:hypothetical protein n=1 Tax=Aureimonas sp. AU40 TaxID=1637747 RepID=UPI0007837ABD|nr:hypothetical protein [Aureimonas sp. AU40]
MIEHVIHDLSPLIQQDVLTGRLTVADLLQHLARKGVVVSREYLVSQIGTGLEAMEKAGRTGALSRERWVDPVVLKLSDRLKFADMHPSVAKRYQDLTGKAETYWDVVCRARVQEPPVTLADRRRTARDRHRRSLAS